MKNKIVTLLCIMTILITTGIVAANSDGANTISDTAPKITNLVNMVAIDKELYEDIKLVPKVESNGTGATDKTVQVQNIGDNSVFVRTVFAFEAGALSWEDIHTGFNYNNGWTYSGCSEISIGGHKYYMVVATYDAKLNMDAVTTNSLQTIGLYKNAAVTSDKVASLGGDFEMRIVSQATLDKVNFDNDPINAENHPWLNNN